MDAVKIAKKLETDFAPPWMSERAGEVRFYWESRLKPYPRSRYRLTYDIDKRALSLRRFVKLRHGTSKEMSRSIDDEGTVAVFRAALLPEQLAHITRLAMPKAA